MAVRVMAATAAVMAGARLGIVLLTFGMTPVLVLLVMAPKAGGVPGVGGGGGEGRVVKTGVVGVGVPTLPHTGRSPRAGRSLCIMWRSWGGGGGHCGGVRGRGRRISLTTAIGLWGDWEWLEGWGTCDMEVGTSPGADWTKVTNGAAIHPGSD